MENISSGEKLRKTHKEEQEKEIQRTKERGRHETSLFEREYSVYMSSDLPSVSPTHPLSLNPLFQHNTTQSVGRGGRGIEDIQPQLPLSFSPSLSAHTHQIQQSVSSLNTALPSTHHSPRTQTHTPTPTRRAFYFFRPTNATPKSRGVVCCSSPTDTPGRGVVHCQHTFFTRTNSTNSAGIHAPPRTRLHAHASRTRPPMPLCRARGSLSMYRKGLPPSPLPFWTQITQRKTQASRQWLILTQSPQLRARPQNPTQLRAPQPA